MKTLVAVAILTMATVSPALARHGSLRDPWQRQQAPQQGYQSSERPGYYHGYPLKDWYHDDGW